MPDLSYFLFYYAGSSLIFKCPTRFYFITQVAPSFQAPDPLFLFFLFFILFQIRTTLFTPQFTLPPPTFQLSTSLYPSYRKGSRTYTKAVIFSLNMITDSFHTQKWSCVIVRRCTKSQKMLEKYLSQKSKNRLKYDTENLLKNIHFDIYIHVFWRKNLIMTNTLGLLLFF